MILAATLITVPVVLLTTGLIRVALAVVFVLFSPGYALIAALYPRKDSIDGIERVALSFGTSIAVVPMIGLLLNYTEWGIRLFPILIGIDAFILAMCTIAWLRRSRLYTEERFAIQFTLPQVDWHAVSTKDRVLTGMLFASILFALGVLMYVLTTPKQGEEFTEFYILAISGEPTDLPTAISVGQPTDIVIGIVNHEGEPVTYQIRARLSDNETAVRLSTDGNLSHQVESNAFAVGPLADEGEWKNTATITPLVSGERQKLQLLLFTPRMRTDQALRAPLAEEGYATVKIDEEDGEAHVTLQAAGNEDHTYRIEAWQSDRLAAATEFHLSGERELREKFEYPAGETVFKLYDNGVLVLDDSGAELTLHLWVDVE